MRMEPKDLFRHILEWKGHTGSVVKFVQPEILLAEMERKMSQGIKEDEELKELSNFVLEHCVDTSHPLFVNQLYGGVHPIGLAASVIVEKMNTNAHTYEAAPIFVLAERIVLSELRKLFYGNEEGDGIFSPGGSMANMYGFILARHQKFPQVKDDGLSQLKPLVIFTSEDAHYSASKAANWMGVGLNNVIQVDTNKNGQMIPSALQKAISNCRFQGKYPLVVNATLGTTVLGAFDDLNAISKVCRDEGVWLHCDAAWGGSFIFSERLRFDNMQGIEKCDSIAWNAHKMLGAPLQCSIFITKHSQSLAPCNAYKASYLFQPDKFYPVEFDTSGDKSFQCGRKADAFKLWFMWTAIGVNGFKNLVENAEDCARYFTDMIRDREDFFLYLDVHQCTNVFFWYIPQRLRGLTLDDDWWQSVADVAVKIKERMVLEGGHMMIGYCPLPHKRIPNALRLVLPAYAPKTHHHMDQIIQYIVNFGQEL